MHERGRWWRRGLLAVVVVVAVGAGWWGGRVTLAPAAAHDTPSAAPVTAAVRQASVGRAVSLNVTVAQPFSLVATNSLAGIVTAVGAGGEVKTGDELYAVAGRAVYALAGSTPFYRDLARDESGPDVTQLQQALVAWGFTAPTSGVFDDATLAAVKTWQKATGQPDTGVVALGTVLAIPRLPAVVKLGEEIVLGARVAGGEQGVLARAGEPSFALVLSQDQAALVPAGALVDVHSGSSTWSASVAGSTVDPNGNVSLQLTAPDGSLVCGDECGSLPADEQVTLLASVHLVPATSGPAVPVAAVRTAADGSTYVLLADGTRRPVTVEASGDGVAIVEGVAVGAQVVVLDTADGRTAQEGAPGPAVTDGSDG